MSPPLRIVLTGNFHENPTMLAFRHAFHKLGHKTTEVWVENYYRVGLLNRWTNRLLSPVAPTPDFWGTKKYQEALLKAVCQTEPHVVICADPILVSPATLQLIKIRTNAALLSWLSCDVFLPENGSRFFYDAISQYDCHFSGVPSNFSELIANGAKHVEEVSPAVIPIPNSIRRRAPDKKSFGVGVFGRRSHLTELVLTHFRRNHIAVTQFATLEPEKLSPLYQNLLIAIPTSKEANFVVPALGALVLFPRENSFNDLFREGIEADYFGGMEELVSKVKYYLSHSERCSQIARQGLERARRPDLCFESQAAAVVTVVRRHFLNEASRLSG